MEEIFSVQVVVKWPAEMLSLNLSYFSEDSEKVHFNMVLKNCFY